MAADSKSMTFRRPARKPGVHAALFCFLLVAVLVFQRTGFCLSIDEYAAKAFKKIKSKLVKITELKSRSGKLPDHSYFSEDKKSNARKINKLLENALNNLEITKLSDYRKEYEKLENYIHECRDEIEKKRIDSIDAPKSVKGIRKYWTKTLKDYADEIKELETKIQNSEKKKKGIVEKMRGELKKMGLPMETRQIEFMLSTVSGDDILDISAVFFNVKQINLKLAELLKQSGEKVDIARKYYGMHVSLVGIVLYAYETYIAKLKNQYMPEVKKLLKENEEITRKTRELIRRNVNTDVIRKLKSNLKAQALTEKACNLYIEYLNSQLDKAIAVKQRLKTSYDVAFNTYKTVEVAANLVSIIDTSMKDFDVLQQMQLPDLIEFKNRELQEKFIIITRKLKSKP